jgi:ketosteroid isomerase-like protein
MSPIHYLDFDLRIQRTEDGFCSQVLNSPAGEATSSCEGRIFTDLELESFLFKLGPRRALRRVGSPESAAAKDLGGRLFDSTFRGEVRDCLRQSLARAEEQGAWLRIRLRLKDAPELANYPWEYLYDRSVNWFVALSGEAPVVRHLDLPLAIRPLKISLPLRILVMISTPSGCPRLGHEREEKLVNEAFGPLAQQGKVELTRLPDATLDTLDRRLARGEYHILHFVGHGAFDRQIDDGVLILEDHEKQQRWTTGEALGVHLRVHRTLRLAVLNACEGARGTPHDPFSGVAQSLAQQGLPAVIAMQFEITDAAAVDFSRGFYGALLEGYPVDAALSRARLVLHANNHGLEWGTPVLYLRSRDGVVFESEETRPSNVNPNPLPIVRAHVRVFLSYSHDDKEHCDRVLALAQQLRRDGIDADLDQFHHEELLHWPRWCEERMRPENSDYVLCVCSRDYRNRVEGRVAADVGKGVFWEGTLLYNALYDKKGQNPRFIAVLLGDVEEAHIPQILSGYTRFRLSSFELADPQSDYGRLYRLLTGQRGSRSNEPGQLKKLDALPEKPRRTDFFNLDEVLTLQQDRLSADQRDQQERERLVADRHQKEARERLGAGYGISETERGEPKEKPLGGPPKVAVLAPSAGDRWETGSTRSICWKAVPDSSEIKLESFALELWEGAAVVERLVDRAGLLAHEQPSFDWTVSDKLNPGSNYRIRVNVWDELGHSGEGFSDVFAIASNPPLLGGISSIEQAHPKLPLVDQASQPEPVQKSGKLVEELPPNREPWSWVKPTRLKIQVAFFSLALLVIGAAIYFGFRPTEFKKPVAIEQLNPITEKLHEAIIKGDASAVASLYTEDAILLSDQGASYGREAIEKHWADVFKQITIVDQHDATNQNSPHSLGTVGNEAWSNGQWTSSFRSYGGSYVQHANGLWFKIYHREGDTWKIRADVGFTVR